MNAKVMFGIIFIFSSALGAPSPLIDLGYELNENTQFWPGVQRFNITSEVQRKDENGIPWYAANSFETAEHVGTHVDAPFHFNENGWKVTDIPLERLIAPVSGFLLHIMPMKITKGTGAPTRVIAVNKKEWHI
ncbi:hypothetical protein C0J52_03427 [Blattella germanica]|nr:hypothetical protein C0J52_03427 [Blattella germanica]